MHINKKQPDIGSKIEQNGNECSAFSNYIKYGNQLALMQFCGDKPGSPPCRTKHRFSHEEDELLMDLVSRYGQKWSVVASHMPGRTGRQCRDRFRDYLDISLHANPWTDEETKLLIEKYSQLGAKWTKIASFFQYRTPGDVKNHYASTQKSVAVGGQFLTDKVKRLRTHRPKHSKKFALTVWRNSHPQSMGDGREMTTDANMGAFIVWDTVSSRTGNFDLGHIPGKEYSLLCMDLDEGRITEAEFYAQYRDPKYYQIEQSRMNQSHQFEKK